MWRIWILCIYPTYVSSRIMVVHQADPDYFPCWLPVDVGLPVLFNLPFIPSMNASTFWTRNAKLAGSYPALNWGALRCAVPPRFPDIFGAVLQHLDFHDGCGLGVWTLYCMVESHSWVVPLKLTLKFPGMSCTSCPVCSGWKWRCVVNFTVNIPLNKLWDNTDVWLQLIGLPWSYSMKQMAAVETPWHDPSDALGVHRWSSPKSLSADWGPESLLWQWEISAFWEDLTN